MWRSTILFTVIATTIIFINEIDSSPLRKANSENIRQTLQLHQQQKPLYQNKVREKFKIDEQSQETDDSHYGSLKRQELEKFIQEAIRERHHKKEQIYREEQTDWDTLKGNQLHGYIDNRYTPRTYYGEDKDTYSSNSGYGKINKVLYNDKYRSRYDDHNQLNRDLKVILTEAAKLYNKKQYNQSKPRKQRLQSNDLLEQTNSDMIEDIGDLDGYSKVYIILNPQAIQKSSKKDSLANMISKILRVKKKERQYKGFVLLNGIDIGRRYNRDSRESVHAPRDTMDDDYRPKRSRNDYGGGGGGGRTPIPYIGHRGDAYERDI